MDGKILAVNTGSTSTKIGLFRYGEKIFEQTLTHTVDVLSEFGTVMEQKDMRCRAVIEFLESRGVDIVSVDIIMARGGLLAPVVSGVYEIDDAMCEALREGKEGMHACNLSAIIADEIAKKINLEREKKGLPERCRAFIADPPMADEMLPEAKLGGHPEFPRRALFHALNSRAMVRRYAFEHGRKPDEVTAIVAHMGGGTSVSVHMKGRVIDTTDSLGGDGPITPERAGTIPAFPIVDLCFSGRRTKEEIQKMLVGKGGAVAYFGTNDFVDLIARAKRGDADVRTFIEAFCLSVSKYIGYFSAVVCGKADAIILTGGIAKNAMITDEIRRRVEFIAPVVVYPGEDELQSLAENGCAVLSGEAEIRHYHSS